MASSQQRRGRAKAADRRRMGVYAGIGGAVVVLAVVIGVLSADDAASRVEVADVAGTPTIEGEPLAAAPEDPSADPEVGEPVPVVVGEDFAGNEVTIGAPGSPQLVMFMASWCPACQQELPEVVSWLEEDRLPEGVELVSVVTNLDDTRPNWPPQDWFDREGYEGPLLVDDAEASVASAWGLRATPFWVAVDAEGRVAARVSGLLGADQLDQLATIVAP